MTATEPTAPTEPPPTEPSVPRTQIAQAFSIQLVCRILGMLASIASVAMSARYLGPGRYGELMIAVAFIGMWASLSDLDIGTIIVRRVTSGRGDLERLVRINSGLSLAYSVPLAVLAAASGLLIYDDPDVRVMLVVLAGSLLMVTMTARFEPVFLTTVRFTAVAISDVAGRFVTLGTVVWLVATQATVIWFAVVQLIPPALQLAIQGAAAARHISVRPIFSSREALDLLRESLPVMGAAVIGIVYWRADGVILSLTSTHAEVGVYGLAYTIAGNTAILSTFFLKSTLSTATELFSRDLAAFAGFLRRSVELMCFAAVPVAVVGTLLAGPLTAFFGDRAFVGRGTPTLALLFIAIALRFVASTLGQGLLACHQQRFFFRLFVVALVVNIVLNLVLDGPFGAVGAGVSLVCTELSGLAVANWRLNRGCGYRMPGAFVLRLLVPTAASAAMALVLSSQHVAVVVTAAAAVYLTVNLVLGPVTWSTLAATLRKDVSV